MSAQHKILVIDDDPVNRDFFQLMLSRLGFVVEQASDGLIGLEKLEQFHPDLILLDNVMPRMTGFELTKIAKENAQYRTIPIIMFSALDDAQDKVAGFELGIDDYITKPFNFTEVLARIKAALRNRELFAQIMVRETRLNLAEGLSADLKRCFCGFAGNIDDIDSAVAVITSREEPMDREALARWADAFREKTQKLRKGIAELDARVEKTVLEWEALKKNEIGLSTLEMQIRKFFHQDLHE